VKRYTIRFAYDGAGDLEPQTRKFEGVSPGHAQKKCRREYPGCKILETLCDARLNPGCGTFGMISYPTVSTADVEPIKVPKTEQAAFGFLNECVSYRPQPTQ
jgi:hypothetical protein